MPDPDPDPDNSDYVVFLPEGVETTIDGFTITRGNADGNILARGGGGICSQRAKSTLQNLIITRSHAARDGGAGSWSDLEPTDYSLDSETGSGGK